MWHALLESQNSSSNEKRRSSRNAATNNTYEIKVDHGAKYLASNTRSNTTTKRHIQLHTYINPKPRYAEVKVGGHAQDHLRTTSKVPRYSPYTPMKNTSRNRHPQSSSSGRRQSVWACPKIENSSVTSIKCGGHALDHLRFLGTGKPSRPIIVINNTRLITTTSSSTICSRCNVAAVTVNLPACSHGYCNSCIRSAHKRSSHNSVYIYCTGCHSYVVLLRDLSRANLKILAQWIVAEKQQQQLLHQKLNTTLILSCPVLIQTLGRCLASSKKLLLCATAATKEELWKKKLSLVDSTSKLRRYEFISYLGGGNFADVYVVRKKENNKLVVLKESDRMTEATNELQILMKLKDVKSKNVIKVHDAFATMIGYKQYMYIEMEYCENGDLKSLIDSGKVLFTAAVVTRFLKQLCSALQEIHRLGVIHRDLKPSNVLLTDDWCQCVITDFGVSSNSSSNKTFNAAGTIGFMAPEVRQAVVTGEQYDSRADIWSLGALGVSMLCGNSEPLIAKMSYEELSRLVRERISSCDPLLAYIICQALQPDPNFRATLQEIEKALAECEYIQKRKEECSDDTLVKALMHQAKL